MPIITGKQKKLRYLPVAKADTPFKALDDSFVKFSLVLSLFCSVTVCLFWINLTHTHTHTHKNSFCCRLSTKRVLDSGLTTANEETKNVWYVDLIFKLKR